MSPKALTPVDPVSPPHGLMGESDLGGRPPMAVTIRHTPVAPAPERMSKSQLIRYRHLKLRALADSANLNMRILANRAGVSHSYISHIIKGDRTPSLRVCLYLADALYIDLRELAEILEGGRLGLGNPGPLTGDPETYGSGLGNDPDPDPENADTGDGPAYEVKGPIRPYTRRSAPAPAAVEGEVA